MELMAHASPCGSLRDLVLVINTFPILKDDFGIHLATLLRAATNDLTGLASGGGGTRFLGEIAF